MQYQPRHIEPTLRHLATHYPVIAISGPRQSGKSTLARHFFSNHQYVSLEDLDDRQFATDDPRGFLAQFTQPVIIDEIQNVPSLFSYLQAIVDEKKLPAHFILTGSSQLDLMAGVTQSLAGRACVLQLLPLTLAESSLANITTSLEETLFAGSYPSIHFDKMPIVDWYQDYCLNYLERDVRKILNIKDLGTFQIFLRMCAARCGQLINYSSFASDCGISPNTAKEWMNILEASFIIYRLAPYYRNFSKRLIKSPKLYFYDTGVACSLLGIRSAKELITHTARGGIFESWVISELKKMFFNRHRIAPVFFWRDNKGVEIDLVIDDAESLSIIEIKSGKTIDPSFFQHLNYFSGLAQNAVRAKYLVYGGEKAQPRNDGQVLPWQQLATIKLLHPEDAQQT